MNVEQVAEKLGASPGIVRRWLREGRLKGVKVDGEWHIKKTDLENFQRHQAEYRVKRKLSGTSSVRSPRGPGKRSIKGRR